MKISDMLNNYEVKIVYFKSINTMSLLHSGHPRALNESINRFRQWRINNHLSLDKYRTFNIPFSQDYSHNPNLFQLLLAVEIKENNYPYTLGFEEKKFPNMRCAKIRHYGSDDQLDHISRYLKGAWLFESYEKMSNFPLFFERVSFSKDIDEDEWITDVYLPLEEI